MCSSIGRTADLIGPRLIRRVLFSCYISLVMAGASSLWMDLGKIWPEAVVQLPRGDNGRKKRQTTDQRNKIEEILDREFCGSIQNFLTGNTCRIQSIQYKDNGSGGILVNFLIIIGPFASLLSTIVAQLKSANDGLDMIEEFQFLPGVISGKLISAI